MPITIRVVFDNFQCAINRIKIKRYAKTRRGTGNKRDRLIETGRKTSRHQSFGVINTYTKSTQKIKLFRLITARPENNGMCCTQLSTGQPDIQQTFVSPAQQTSQLHTVNSAGITRFRRMAIEMSINPEQPDRPGASAANRVFPQSTKG